jgi:adenylylsulfate kinase-like enzyme
MTASLAGLLPLSVLEPDGLIVTTAGRYVRMIECERVPNALTADPVTLGAIERAYANVCRTIPDYQGIVVYAQTDPVPLKEALEADLELTEVAADADRARGHHALACSRERLLEATTQTVLAAAGAEQPAVAARWWIAVPYSPRLETARDQLRSLAARSKGRTLWSTHREAAIESARVSAQVEAALRSAGIETYPLDGTQTLALLWERLHPATETECDLDRLAAACRVATATTVEEARNARHALLLAACDGPVCGIDAGEDAGWLRHADGTLEEVLHLGSPPAYTDASWLSHLLCCPLPATLAVHIGVGGRVREQARQRRRWKRLRAAVLYKERRDRVVGSDEHEALEEAASVDAELAGEIGASVYRVGIYCSIRDPQGRLEYFKRTVKQAAEEFHALTNARVIRGRRLCLPGFTSTLPIGVDELRATRSYAQRSIAHCVALTSSRCGSPGGVIVGTADPGGTIERADPFDPVHPRRVTLIVGPSGGGKTVLTNALCLRYIAQGGRAFVLDRSSTPDEHGNTRGTGHYDTLASLIPGARRVQVGHAGGDVICPWDVADPGRAPAHKTELLLALHALLIGHAHDPEGRVRTLDSDEETLIRTGIEAAYKLAGETGERPREQLLIDALNDRAATGSLTGANADRLQSLLLRLEPYGEHGSLAHIADTATTVPADTPLTLFDFTGLSERLTPALMLATVEYVERQVQRLRRARVDGALDHLGSWAGKCQLIVEEGWALTQSPAAGAWLNEYARRSRHYALWLMFVSQHFRDLSNEQGRALLANGALSFCLRNDRDDLEHAREPLGLSDTDIAQIQALPKQHGVYSTVYMVSARGRGAVRVALGDLEYWICSSDPEHDQPRRAAALRETAGDPWAALEKLCTPSWHERYRQANGAAA